MEWTSNGSESNLEGGLVRGGRSTFQAEKGEIELKGKLTSRVIHTVTESIEQGEIGSIGLEFQEPLEEVRSQLNPVFRALGAGPSNT